MKFHMRHMLVAAGLLAGMTTALADDREARVTAAINDKSPTVAQVEAALFPENMEAQKKECAQLEKVGVRCQSTLPKSSLESAQVTFGRGSAKLTPDGKEFLDIVGKALQKRTDTWSSLVIEGHTDVTGSVDTNRKLSLARAEAAKNYLEIVYGLRNIEAVGRGSDQLRDEANPTAEINRRIEFIPNW